MKKSHPWQKAYSGKVRRKTPPQRRRISLEGHFTKHGDIYVRSPKARRVFVTLELETTESLEELRQRGLWSRYRLDPHLARQCLQVQANVARGQG